MGLLMGGIDDAFYIPDLKKNLKYLENIIHKQHEKGSKYFVGDKLSGADIILEFPVITNIFQNKRGAEQLGAGDVEKEYPHLNQWAEDIKRNPNTSRLKNWLLNTKLLSLTFSKLVVTISPVCLYIFNFYVQINNLTANIQQ